MPVKTNIEALRETLLAFDHCELKLGARGTLIAQGYATARVLVLGDAPRRAEDAPRRAGGAPSRPHSPRNLPMMRAFFSSGGGST